MKFSILNSQFSILKSRWRNAMPRFFRVLFWVCSLISGTALAVNTAIVAGGSAPHEWWQDIYPYLLGFPAGIAFAAKFTQQYHGKPVSYDEHRRAERTGRTVLDCAADNQLKHGTVSDSPDAENSAEEPADMEPIDNGDI